MAEREPYPSERQDRFIVRLPDGMRDRIKSAADANNRSMNAEIVGTLEEKYPPPNSILPAPVRRLLEDIMIAPDRVRDQIYPLLRQELDKAGIPLSEKLSEHAIAILLGWANDPKREKVLDSARRRHAGRFEQSDGFGDGDGAYGDSDGEGDGFGDGLYGDSDGNGDGTGAEDSSGADEGTRKG